VVALMGMPTTWIGRAACALGTAAALAAALPSTAAAASATLRDGNDTVGPLDVRSVTVSHGRTGPVSFAITTYGRWHTGLLRPGRGAILIFLDTRGTPAYDRYAFVSEAHGSLRAAVKTIRGRTVGRATAARTSRRSAVVTLRRGLLGSRGGFGYAVFAIVQARSGPCAGDCVDAVPDHGPAHVDLGARADVSFAPDAAFLRAKFGALALAG
jgi:hypothetical protein